MAGRASDELHELLDRVVVSYDQDATNHILDMQGDLITMLKNAKPAEEAGIDDAKSSLNLVAGGRTKRLSPDSADQCEALVARTGFKRRSLIAVYGIEYG